MTRSKVVHVAIEGCVHSTVRRKPVCTEFPDGLEVLSNSLLFNLYNKFSRLVSIGVVKRKETKQPDIEEQSPPHTIAELVI